MEANTTTTTNVTGMANSTIDHTNNLRCVVTAHASLVACLDGSWFSLTTPTYIGSRYIVKQ
jgi:hypothetical protein